MSEPKIKLTPPQLECLTIMARDLNGMGAVDGYKPIEKLVALGMAKRHQQKFGGARFTITGAGTAFLATLSEVGGRHG